MVVLVPSTIVRSRPVPLRIVPMRVIELLLMMVVVVMTTTTTTATTSITAVIPWTVLRLSWVGEGCSS